VYRPGSSVPSGTLKRTGTALDRGSRPSTPALSSRACLPLVAPAKAFRDLLPWARMGEPEAGRKLDRYPSEIANDFR
jgi:hypothetical protein